MKTMKRITAFTIACCLCILCCACGGNQGTDPSSSEEDTTPAESAAGVPDETPSEVLSEKAMDNFVKRLEAGNYVVRKEGFLKTTVCSPDLVYFLYDDESFDDVAYITLDNETFQGVLGEDAVGDIAFASTEDAVRTARALLPNYWMTAGEGNMFNLFYNNVEKPLEFVSYEDAVKTTLIALAGYGDSAPPLP